MRFVLVNGVQFVTFQNQPTDEVYGWFEKADGTLIKGSGGWWRTDDPQKAAASAHGTATLKGYEP